VKCLFEVGAYPSVDLVFHSRATPPFIEILWQEDLLELLLVINDVNKKDDRYRWKLLAASQTITECLILLIPLVLLGGSGTPQAGLQSITAKLSLHRHLSHMPYTACTHEDVSEIISIP